jgi:hypothetical protein
MKVKAPTGVATIFLPYVLLVYPVPVRFRVCYGRVSSHNGCVASGTV